MWHLGLPECRGAQWPVSPVLGTDASLPLRRRTMPMPLAPSHGPIWGQRPGGQGPALSSLTRVLTTQPLSTTAPWTHAVLLVECPSQDLSPGEGTALTGSHRPSALTAL